MRCQKLLRIAVLGLVSLCWTSAVPAAVKLPAVIGDNMVLQRGQPVPIWGWADKGEEVTVAVAGQTLTTKAGDDGRWKVVLGQAGRRPAAGNDRQRLVRQRDHAEEHPRRRGLGLLRPVEHGNGRRRVQGRQGGDRRGQLSADPPVHGGQSEGRRSRPTDVQGGTGSPALRKASPPAAGAASRRRPTTSAASCTRNSTCRSA